MDPNQEYQPQEILQAYHMASQAGDTNAMNDLHGMLLKHYQTQDAAQNNPTNGMSEGELAGAGVAHGIERPLRGLGNMVGLGRVFPSVFGDAALKDEDQRFKPLLDTTAGKAGDVGGQVLATAPLGMGTGALAERAGAALAGRAATATPWVARVLRLANAARKPAIAAGENALQSAAAGDADQQGSDAESGAGLGAALSVLGGVGGRLVRGLVKKSGDAQALIDKAQTEGHDLFIPISQGGTGPAKTMYQKVLPYALGVEGQLKDQSGEAADTVRRMMFEGGMPLHDLGDGQEMRLTAPLKDTPEETADAVRAKMDRLYKSTIGSRRFNVPFNFRDEVVRHLKDEDPEIPDGVAQQIADTVHGSVSKYMEGAGADAARGAVNNGSGESAASWEAIGRLADEKARGNKPFFINPDGQPVALAHTVDGVDVAAPKGHIKVQVDPSDGQLKIVDRGGLKAPQANGLLNRFKALNGSDNVTAKVRAAEPDVNIGNGEITGNNLLRAREDARQALNKAMQKGDFQHAPWRESGINTIHNIVEDALAEHEGMVADPERWGLRDKHVDEAQDFIRDMNNYKRLNQGYRELAPVLEAAESAKATPERGAFKFSDVAKNAQPGTKVRQTAQEAHAVLEKENPGSVNPAGRHFLNEGLLLGAGIPAAMGSGIGESVLGTGAGLIAGGNALARKGTQKFLYGDLARQQAMAKFLRQNPRAAYSLGLAGRSAADASGQ